MKIVKVKLHVVGLSRNTDFINQHILVRIETDEGATGSGQNRSLIRKHTGHSILILNNY